MKYQPPFGSLDPDASYVDKDVPSAVTGSRVGRKAIEHPQREIQTVISQAGLTPSEGDLTQLWQAIRRSSASPDNDFFLATNGFTATPPGAPGEGARYLVAAAATGAWAGQDGKIALYQSGGWLFISPSIGLVGATPDGAYYRASGTGWVAWVASDTLRALTRLATAAEAADPTNLANPLTPGTLPDRLTKAYRTVYIYTSSTTWTKPVDSRFVGVEVRLIGGGASGGVSNSGTTDILSGGGGSNGAEIVDYYRASELGVSSYSVTVGTGGASVAHAGAPADGNAGGASAVFDLQANGGNPGTGLGGLTGAGGAAQTTGATRVGKSLFISGTRGADGNPLAGLTFPTSLGSIGQGGQGGYKTTGGPNSNSNAGGNGVVIITEFYT